MSSNNNSSNNNNNNCFTAIKELEDFVGVKLAIICYLQYKVN